jgi:hypothetical protein
MQSIVGTDPSAYDTPLGYFCPGTPMASDAGLEVPTTPRDTAKTRAALKTAGLPARRSCCWFRATIRRFRLWIMSPLISWVVLA